MAAHPIIAELRRVRQERKLSQEEMAGMIRMASGQTYVSRVEGGQHDPLLATIDGWAQALGYELVLKPKGSS